MLLGRLHAREGRYKEAELAFREEGVKVTLALSRRSVEFFKSEATKHHTQYQRMIRRLLDAYVEAQQGAAESGKAGRARGARRSGGTAR